MQVSHGTLLDRTFYVSLILKGLDGVLELIGGLVLLLVSPAQIQAVVAAATRGEILEDPHDWLSNLLIHYAGQLNVSLTLFGAFYLLVHGLVKVVLVAAVLKEQLWAYPWMIGFLVAFIAYQGYELTRSFTVGLLLLTVFDIFVVVMTVIEYGRQKAKRPLETARV